ncbi:MAG: hypothetical protein RL030_952 [Pseudomonadota bacterium]
MKTSKLAALTASIVVGLATVPAARAHHSAAQFDFMKTRTVQGVVKSFRVVNPHTQAVVTLSDATGTRDVEFEGHSASNFFRAGYNRDEVKVGDKISVLIAPRRDGTDGGFILAFTTEAGHTVGFGGLSPSTGKTETPPAQD